MSADLSLGAEARATIRLGLPLIGGQVAQMAAGVVETMLAGHLGAGVLGAVAVGNSIWVLAVLALVGMMMAVSPSVAQLDGAGRRGETAPVFVQATWIALAMGVLLTALLLLIGPASAALAEVNPALRAPVRAFLAAAATGTPGFGLFLACRGLTDGLGRTRVSMGFALLGLAVLAPLGWVLMYGRFGAPALGALGAGIAIAVTCWIESPSWHGLWLRDGSPGSAGRRRAWRRTGRPSRRCSGSACR